MKTRDHRNLASQRALDYTDKIGIDLFKSLGVLLKYNA